MKGKRSEFQLGVVYKSYGEGDRVIHSFSKYAGSPPSARTGGEEEFGSVHRVVYNPAKNTVSVFSVRSLQLYSHRRNKSIWRRRWNYVLLIRLDQGELYSMYPRRFTNITFKAMNVWGIIGALPIPVLNIVWQYLFETPLTCYIGSLEAGRLPRRVFLKNYKGLVYGSNLLDLPVCSGLLENADYYDEMCPTMMRTIARSSGLREACQKMFGTSGKTATGLFYKSGRVALDVLTVVRAFSKYLPWDFIMAGIKDVYSRAYMDGNNPSLSPTSKYFRGLGRLPQRIIKRGFLATCEFVRFYDHRVRTPEDAGIVDQYNLFYDAVRLAAKLPYRHEALRNLNDHADSIQDLHDYLAREYEIYSTHKDRKTLNRKIQFSPERRKELDSLELKYEGWSLRYPRTKFDIKQWGSTMHHCIFSYSDQFASGHLILLGLYHGDQLEANIMLVKRDIDDTRYELMVQQFYGRYNARPTAEQFAAFGALTAQLPKQSFGNVQDWVAG